MQTAGGDLIKTGVIGLLLPSDYEFFGEVKVHKKLIL